MRAPIKHQHRRALSQRSPALEQDADTAWHSLQCQHAWRQGALSPLNSWHALHHGASTRGGACRLRRCHLIHRGQEGGLNVQVAAQDALERRWLRARQQLDVGGCPAGAAGTLQGCGQEVQGSETVSLHPAATSTARDYLGIATQQKQGSSPSPEHCHLRDGHLEEPPVSDVKASRNGQASCIASRRSHGRSHGPVIVTPRNHSQ
jgi:hypothetical protein